MAWHKVDSNGLATRQIHVLRAGSHGSQVSSPTYVSKSQLVSLNLLLNMIKYN